MNAMNQIIIEGNLVRTPAFKETATGKKVCTMPIAVNRIFKDTSGKEINEVGYYDIEAWGEKFTDILAKCGFKGRGVRVVGRLKQDRWQDDGGKSHSKVYIVAEHIDFKPAKKAAFQKESQETEERNFALASEGTVEF